MSDTEIAPAPASGTANLEDGIKRGEQTIKTLDIRKPGAGELRGLALQDLMRADVGAIITLLPRISNPTITTQEAEQMTPVDFAECAGVIASFFLNSAQRKMLAEMSTS